MNKIKISSGGLLYVDGSAGCGNAFLINTILNSTRGQEKVALSCTCTGFATQLYPGGQTAHILFGIPVRDDPTDLCRLEPHVNLNFQKAALLGAVSLVVWDEPVSSHKMNFQAADDLMEKLMETTDIPSGGALLIAAGDFIQIPPIVTYGSKKRTIRASIKNYSYWQSFEVFTLTQPMEHIDDQPYAR